MILKLEVQVVNRLTGRFVFLEMQVLEIRMSQGINYIYSFFRIEGQKFFQKVNGFRISKGKQFIEVFSILFVLGKVLD